jgi:hypothetical protein
MRHPISRTLAGAAAFAGIIALAACPAVAAVASPARHTSVPCDTAALDSAISSAASGDTLALAAGCTYKTSAALPGISTNLTIVGHGATLEYTGSNDPGADILSVPAGVTLHVSNLNFVGGGGTYLCAGAIATDGNVTIDGGTFDDNHTDSGYSGAICNGGQLTVRGATFTKNGGEYAMSGAIYNSGRLMAVDTTFTDNGTVEGNGGAIYNNGRATLRHDTLSGNIADESDGGAIFNQGTLTVVSTSISNNTAIDGGGIANNGGTVSLQHDTLSGNSAYIDGGAILNEGALTVVSSSISDNTASTGGAGGISNQDGTVSLRRDCIMSNTPVNCFNVPGCKG